MTFPITDEKLYQILYKSDVSQSKDKRDTSSQKLDYSDIVTYIKSFLTYQSHYTRKNNPNRKYLHLDLSIRLMHDLYKEKCQTEMTEPRKLKYDTKIFNTKFNLHFKTPRQVPAKLVMT